MPFGQPTHGRWDFASLGSVTFGVTSAGPSDAGLNYPAQHLRAPRFRHGRPRKRHNPRLVTTLP